MEDLRCAWIAMVQHNDDRTGNPDAAACIISAWLAELVASSLISIDDDGHQHRCVDVLAAVPNTLISASHTLLSVVLLVCH